MAHKTSNLLARIDMERGYIHSREEQPGTANATVGRKRASRCKLAVHPRLHPRASSRQLGRSELNAILLAKLIITASEG